MGLTTHECGKWPLTGSEANSLENLDSIHDACGYTKLQRAIVYNSDDTHYWAASNLLRKGASPDAESGKGEPTLHVAVGRCRYHVVGLLLDHGVKRDTVWHGRTALEYARYLRREVSLSKADYDNLDMIIRYLAD